MKPVMRLSRQVLLFAQFLTLSLLTPRALAAPTAAPSPDAALRRALIGTWLYEQDAGLASVAMYTTYREDGTAIQLIKTKFLFKKARGVWIENRWSILNGELHLSPVRFRAHSDDAKIDLAEAIRQRVSADSREMRYELNGKERKESKSGIPDEVQQMIDELSKK
jgi:hypothetical protein